MIDGVDVPVNVSRGGTNPTAIIQAGNLEIGSTNGGAAPFPGKIAQVAVFGAKVTQAQMRTYHSQGYLGTETSLASAYSFNGVATDLNTTTPNDLTAQNSAGYVTDSPFTTQASGIPNGTDDYAITMSVSADGLTEVLQVPEGCAIPTSGGVSAISYSGMDSPYGFPSIERYSIAVIDTVLSKAISKFVPVPMNNIIIANTGNGGGTIRVYQHGGMITLNGLTDATGSIVSGGTATRTIAFPLTFTTEPAVTANPVANTGEVDLLIYQSSAPSSTAASVVVSNPTSGGGAGTCRVSWIAIGSI
jgi:hypothetical protein